MISEDEDDEGLESCVFAASTFWSRDLLMVSPVGIGCVYDQSPGAYPIQKNTFLKDVRMVGV